MGGGGLYMWFYRIQLFSYLFPPRVAKLHKIKNILNDACRSMGKVSMTFKLFFWCFGLGSTVFNVAVFWNSCLSFVIVPMQDDSQCDCRNACNLIKAANRWDLLKNYFMQYRIPRKPEIEIENDDIIGGIAGRCPTCWTCPTRPWCTSRARCERRTWRRWLSSIEHQKIMPAMTTAMALGPGCRGSDAAFRHETAEEGTKEAGIIIDNRPGGCSLQIKLLFLD